MTTKVNWGILGTGAVARQFAQGLRFLPDGQLLAVGSRTLSTAQEFSRQLNVPRAYGSYEELVNDRDVDVVYIATPHTKHKDNCILGLEAGKAILCEKPFTINSREALEVIDLARRKRLFCMEAMWMRFMPLMLRLQDVLDSNAIGEVRMVTIHVGYSNEFNKEDRLVNPALGGGALLDLGIYPLSLAFKLLGSPSSVVSHATMGDTGVDEQSAVILGYPEGQQALLAASLRHSTPNEAVIMGTEGQIRIHAPFYRAHKLSIIKSSPVVSNSNGGHQVRSRIKRIPLVQELYLRLDTLVSPLVNGRPIRIVQPFKGNGYNYEAAEVMRCLKTGERESNIMPLDETFRIMETMDTIRRQWNLKYPQE